MSNKICKCGHSESVHLRDPFNGALVCVRETGVGYCSCMQFELMSEIKMVEANYDALQSPMPCGHLARYAVNEKEGTQYCALCVLEATQLTITNLVNEDDE